VLFVVATASEFRLPTAGMTAEASGATFYNDFIGGFLYIRRHSLLALLITANLLMPLFSFPVQQILVVFAEDVFDRGAGGLGILASVTGVGGLIGAVISANMDARPQKGRLMLLGGIVMGCFLIAFALSPSFWFALVFLAVANIGQMLFMATNNTVITGSVPEEVRGRVMSVTMMSFGLTPLGVIPITIATDLYGAPAAVAGSSLVFLIVIGALFAVSSRLRSVRLDALAVAQLSPSQAAAQVAAGTLSREEADRLTGRIRLD
jgi:MFS family permease